MTTPIWLLDVDGVINAVSRTAPATWDDWERLQARGYPILYSRTVVDTVARIHREGLAEVRWLTTWASHALPLAMSLGITEEFVVAGAPPHREPVAWWKLPVARAVHEREARPVVWTDDDIAYSREAQEWAAARSDVLALAPRTELGLTREHLAEITAFCLSHRPEG